MPTCVAGPKLSVDKYTGEHCDVTPYSSEYTPLKDIPIVNASTAYTDNTDKTIILRINPMLLVRN